MLITPPQQERAGIATAGTETLIDRARGLIQPNGHRTRSDRICQRVARRSGEGLQPPEGGASRSPFERVGGPCQASTSKPPTYRQAKRFVRAVAGGMASSRSVGELATSERRPSRRADQMGYPRWSPVFIRRRSPARGGSRRFRGDGGGPDTRRGILEDSPRSWTLATAGVAGTARVEQNRPPGSSITGRWEWPYTTTGQPGNQVRRMRSRRPSRPPVVDHPTVTAVQVRAGARGQTRPAAWRRRLEATAWRGAQRGELVEGGPRTHS